MEEFRQPVNVKNIINILETNIAFIQVILVLLNNLACRVDYYDLFRQQHFVRRILLHITPSTLVIQLFQVYAPPSSAGEAQFSRNIIFFNLHIIDKKQKYL